MDQTLPSLAASDGAAVDDLMAALGRAARKASRVVAQASGEQRSRALRAATQVITSRLSGQVCIPKCLIVMKAPDNECNAAGEVEDGRKDSEEAPHGRLPMLSRLRSSNILYILTS